MSLVVETTTAQAEAALAQAEELDRQEQDCSVDLYYQAAVLASAELEPWPSPCAGDCPSAEIYRRALAGLIDAGQRYGRLDPRRQLIVVDEQGTCVVPIRYVGFAWQPDDFSRLLPAAGESNREIAQHYASPGLGLPLIGERIAPCSQETFFRPWQPFSVTALLRPAADVDEPVAESCSATFVLELYNPLVFDAVTWNGMPVPLARDLTAPLALFVNETPRQYLRGFTAPSDTSVQPKLVMVEPYQRGKIPVVFIHGLYSDAITWVDMLNELRAQPDLYAQFQFWTYSYPTGADIMTSAAVLRQRLQLARDTFDPEHTDAAMDSMVLVGHSLGGLVAKMQITTSYDLLWREIADQPFDAVVAPPDVELRLAEGLFFEPVPMVTRVIFIGTPHNGSGMARRLAGRAGNLLIRFGPNENAEYKQLLADNPDVFKPYLKHRRPTTINLLDPDSPLLIGLSELPIPCSVRLNSIIGTGGTNPFAEPGDGVVAVSSAQHYGESEIFVPAKHEKLHRHPTSIDEVARILRLQAAEAACQQPAITFSTSSSSSGPASLRSASARSR